jgi:hypothetical protein
MKVTIVQDLIDKLRDILEEFRPKLRRSQEISVKSASPKESILGIDPKEMEFSFKGNSERSSRQKEEKKQEESEEDDDFQRKYPLRRYAHSYTKHFQSDFVASE